jgi:outer membrane protein OmpU
MKKVLFATTALVASAGIASAQGVEISGSAEMGVAGMTNQDLYFFQSVDVRFSMTGETDNGLSFGATVDLDDVADMGINGSDPVDIGRNEFADFNVFISGNFGTLTMGDTDGAFDWALQEVNLVGGSINDAETGHAGFNGNSVFDGFGPAVGQVVRYDYTFGDFAFAVSVELDDAGAADPIFQIGGRYDADLGGITVGVGLGYATVGIANGTNSSEVGVSVDATFGGGFSAGINYTSFDNVASSARGAVDSHLAVGVGYETGALGIGVNYGQYEGTGANPNSDGFGLAVVYDLGGGAAVQFGYGSGSTASGATVDSYSLGLSMSF